MSFIENLSGELSSKELSELIERVLPDEKLEKVLLIHPDYTRQDFSDRLVPLVYEHLKKRGLKILHTLNASGTHRAMSEKEVRKKLGLYKEELVFFNHEYANPNALTTVGILSKEFVSE
ncbi:MAG TPA: lactate racemase domain-containing protein, partial [Pseudothermotoga sp.]